MVLLAFVKCGERGLEPLLRLHQRMATQLYTKD
jgi:hypothetical protein